MRTIRLPALIFLVLTTAGAAQAGDLSTELKVGGLAHDVNPRFVDGQPSSFGNHVEEASLDVNFEALFPPFRRLLGGTLSSLFASLIRLMTV